MKSVAKIGLDYEHERRTGEVRGVTIDELTEQAMRLTPEARAHLARELLSSLDSLSESEVEELWLEEAAHRDAELDAGSARSIPAGDVIARARERRA
jgi:hypothetical protein